MAWEMNDQLSSSCSSSMELKVQQHQQPKLDIMEPPLGIGTCAIAAGFCFWSFFFNFYFFFFFCGSSSWAKIYDQRLYRLFWQQVVVTGEKKPNFTTRNLCPEDGLTVTFICISHQLQNKQRRLPDSCLCTAVWTYERTNGRHWCKSWRQP